MTIAPADERLFISTLLRTLTISACVTLISVLLAYPIANAIVSIGGRFSAIMLACVLLPFWTSLLVRTSAWIVILQKEGIVNRALQAIGLTDAPWSSSSTEPVFTSRWCISCCPSWSCR